MPQFTITYRDGTLEHVHGHDCQVEAGGAIVIYTDVLVMGTPRRIVARRITAGASVTEVSASGGAHPD